VVCANGAAARLISAGDRIIIISYAQATPEELKAFAPKVVLLDERNRIQQVSTTMQPEVEPSARPLRG
jgi:aspartate 1-decarboxylase